MHANVANNTIMAADVQTEEEKTQPMACLNRGFSINPQSMECECKYIQNTLFSRLLN